NLLFLLPLLAYASADCFNAKIRLYCGDEQYYGPIVMALWDDTSFIFGGDKKITARDYLVEMGKAYQLRDTRNDCWFYKPYVVFTSYCKKSHGYNLFKEWFDFFKSKFFTPKNTMIYQACRKVPADSDRDVTIQLADEDEC
ncbi:hypothetical protein PFISCL1PPCAC_22517, partial [Pristionchus fissidentatus]